LKDIKKISVPSMSLKEMCEKVQIKRLNLLNVDVEGYGGAVLQSNNWTNPKCRP
jgi:FkbM family methyltransferase